MAKAERQWGIHLEDRSYQLEETSGIILASGSQLRLHIGKPKSF